MKKSKLKSTFDSMLMINVYGTFCKISKNKFGIDISKFNTLQ